MVDVEGVVASEVEIEEATMEEEEVPHGIHNLTNACNQLQRITTSYF